MKDKAAFFKKLSIVIVVALMGVLLVASYFIPIMGPANKRTSATYSCRDVVVAMNAKTQDDLYTENIKEASYIISKSEGKAGELIRVVGVLGLVNAMIGGALIICAIASLFFGGNIFRFSSVAFSVAALCVAISMIALLCVYLGMVTESSYPYSYYYAINAASFVMMGASLFGGFGSWFLNWFDKNKMQVANK